MDNTTGVIIFDITGKILITKPTGGHIWSFPKGLPDEGEELKTAAIRETLEETSLDLTKIKGDFLNESYYQLYKSKKKIVTLFIFKANEQIENVYETKCTSCFELNGEFIPENDKELWLEPKEALDYLHEAQKEILKRLLESF